MRPRLKEAIREAGTTGKRLAETLGVDENTVSRWCGDGFGSLTMRRAEQVAAALGCRVADLLEEEGERVR